MKRNAWSQGLSVTADGTGVVALAGSAMRLLADRVGLTEHLSTALSRRGFVPVHDRGRVLVDLAVLVADGGEGGSPTSTCRANNVRSWDRWRPRRRCGGRWTS